MASSNQELERKLADMYASVFTRKNMSGFQATEVMRGIELMQQTIALKRRSPKQHKVILAYTSNMISSGLRECIAGCVAAGVVDAIVTTAGGIEEDLIKCLGPTLIGDFALDGSTLRDKGLNRIGNLLVPNNNYVLFESFFRNVLHRHRNAQQLRGKQRKKEGGEEHAGEASFYYKADTTGPCDFLRSAGECLESIEKMASERKERRKREETSSNASGGTAASSSTRSGAPGEQDEEDDDGFADHLADIDIEELRVQRQQSVAYQCYRHNVPILCPAFTDGSMGDMTFFFNTSLPGMVVDAARDAMLLEDKVLGGETTSAAVIAVGGGLPKHFALRACMSRCREKPAMRLAHAILITTTSPGVDGSVSAGTPQDEVSQHLLPAAGGEFVHVRVEATLCFPFMCAMSLFPAAAAAAAPPAAAQHN